jgi:hypothetical protein
VTYDIFVRNCGELWHFVLNVCNSRIVVSVILLWLYCYWNWCWFYVYFIFFSLKLLGFDGHVYASKNKHGYFRRLDRISPKIAYFQRSGSNRRKLIFIFSYFFDSQIPPKIDQILIKISHFRRYQPPMPPKMLLCHVMTGCHYINILFRKLIIGEVTRCVCCSEKIGTDTSGCPHII